MVKHLALIMDGNRRWAKKRLMRPWLGHKHGVENVKMSIQYCLDNQIKYLSLYTFSLENFGRTEQEVHYLFALMNNLEDQVSQFIEGDVQVRFIGDRSRIPIDTLKICEKVENETKDCLSLICNFLFCYGGRQEIIAAVNKVVASERKEDLSVDKFKDYLWSGNIPDPDIVIRTGGVKRLSSLLLFQVAYSEIRFLDCFWPDLTKDLLDETVQCCISANKNLGR